MPWSVSRDRAAPGFRCGYCFGSITPGDLIILARERDSVRIAWHPTCYDRVLTQHGFGSFDESCVKVRVPVEACSIVFCEDPPVSTLEGPLTARGERIVFDVDSEGRVVGFELLSEDKPCQHGDRGF